MKSLFNVFCWSLIPFLAVAQYRISDSTLLRHVYNRNLNPELVRNYLFSSSVTKQNAGLLAVANAGDSSYRADIMQCCSESPLKYFALGRLGASEQSAHFIKQKLSARSNSKLENQLFTAFGKCGDLTDAEELLRNKIVKPLISREGFPLALFEFWNRDIRPAGMKAALHEVLLSDSPVRIKAQALFVLARIGPDSSSAGFLLPILHDRRFKQMPLSFRQNALSVVRRLPDKRNFLPFLLKHLHDARYAEKVEIARIVGAYGKIDSFSFPLANKIIKDKNPNIVNQILQSLSASKLNGQGAQNLFLNARSISVSPEFTPHVRAQAIIAVLSHDSSAAPDLRKIIPSRYKLAVFSTFPDLFLHELLDIENSLYSLDDPETHSAITQLMKLKNDIRFSAMFDRLSRHFLNADMPFTISLVLENADSLFLLRNSGWFAESLPGIVLRARSIPSYADALESMKNLPPGLLAQAKILPDTLSRLTKIQPDSLLVGINAHTLTKSYAKILTNKGLIRIQLLPEFAPFSCVNFLKLAKQNYFRSVKFHRVVPGFVVQTGDRSGTGSGGPGYEIISEVSPIHYSRGTVGMARAGFDTEGSQWFITTGDYAHLDGRYTVFGKVVAGMQIADKITQDDCIFSISIE